MMSCEKSIVGGSNDVNDRIAYPNDVELIRNYGGMLCGLRQVFILHYSP